MRSALFMLDSLIRSLSLTKLDADDDRVSVFASRVASTLPQPAEMKTQRRDYGHPKESHLSPPKECACSAYTLSEVSPPSLEITPLWSATPYWRNDWSDGDMKKEECRRVVWSTVTLVAGVTSYVTAVGASTDTFSGLFILDPANVSIFQL